MSEDVNIQARQNDVINIRFVLIILLLIAFGPLSFELYLPAISDIAKDMGTSIVNVQLTITLFPIGYGIGQLIYGPLSEKYGRKNSLLLGIFIYSVASLGCLFSYHIKALILFRMLQSLGAASTVVLARAMVIDRYDEHNAIKILSLVGAVMGFAPAISPILGGYIVYFFSWNSVFVAMTLFSLLVLLIVFRFLRETHTTANKETFRLNSLKSSCIVLFKDKSYLYNVLIMVFFYATLFAFITQTPILFIQTLHLPEHYFGLYFSIIIIFYAVGNFIASRSINYFSLYLIRLTASVLEIFSGCLLGIIFFTHHITLFNVICFGSIAAFATGLILPISSAKAVSSNKENVGIAAGILGFLQMLVSTVLGSVISYCFFVFPPILGIDIFVTGFIGLIYANKLRDRNSNMLGSSSVSERDRRKVTS